MDNSGFLKFHVRICYDSRTRGFNHSCSNHPCKHNVHRVRVKIFADNINFTHLLHFGLNKCPCNIHVCRIFHLLKIHKWKSIYLYYISQPPMSIRVFLSGWILRHGYQSRYCIDSSTRDFLWVRLHFSGFKYSLNCKCSA